MSAPDPMQTSIPTSILSAPSTLPTAWPWGPSRVGAPCHGGERERWAPRSCSARRGKRGENHAPILASIPTPSNRAYTPCHLPSVKGWSGTAGSEGRAAVCRCDRGAVTPSTVTVGSSLRALWVNAHRSTMDTVIGPVWSGIRAGADPGSDKQKTCRRRRV